MISFHAIESAMRIQREMHDGREEEKWEKRVQRLLVGCTFYCVHGIREIKKLRIDNQQCILKSGSTSTTYYI